MKKVLLVALSLFMITPAMQAKDKEEEVKIVLVKEDNSDNYYYEGVVPVEGVTKDVMYKRAKEWILSTFKTADNNVQFDDVDFSIINSATFSIKETSKTWPALVSFKINLKFKDGKYKFRLENVWIKMQLYNPIPDAPYGSEKVLVTKKNTDHINREINKVFLSLSNELELVIKGSKDKEW